MGLGFVNWLYSHYHHTIVEYDDNGNILSKKSLDSEGDVTWSFEYSYDDKGNKISEKSLDSNHS